MNQDRLAQLIARKLSREASTEEQEELDKFLHDHPSDQYFVSLLHDYWTAPVSADDPPGAEERINYILSAAAGKEDRASAVIPTHRRRIIRIGSFAAAAIISVIIITYFLHPSPDTSRRLLTAKREVAAKSGSKSRLLLPDGSTVWLNSESKLSYLPDFTGALREVELEGEAYFDVVKNPVRPFIVHAAGINIKVLGTAFNVRNYPGDRAIEATLIRGLIQVTKNNTADHTVLILHPHEKVVVPKEGSIAEAEPGQADHKPDGPAAESGMVVQQLKKDASDTALAETAWVYNKLVFDGDHFREIADRMERWFNVKITFHDQAVARYRFHVGFENENINEVLTALQVSAPFTFKIHRNEVDIYKK